MTGTGTGVGKTLVSAGLCLHFKADYWKPVQTGSPADTDCIKRFLPEGKIHKSAFHFRAPLSPNQSAEMEGARCELSRIKAPKSLSLIVEGCGGVLVPLNKKHTLLDLMERLKFPVIVTAKSGLGTLNHTLLTLSALRQRNLSVLGLILSGPPHPKNKRDLKFFGKAPVLLQLDVLSPLNKKTLKRAFKKLKIPQEISLTSF